MNEVVVTYICDRKACTNCTYPECSDTVDIRHAINFESFSIGTRDYFAEKDPEEEHFSSFLTQESKDFINRYPILINDLVKKYNETVHEKIYNYMQNYY